MHPIISCIVPCFNSRAYVAEALDSIFAQTYRPIEVIVADDGSTDGTLEVLRRYPEIAAVTQPDRGPAATRNLGLRRAAGELVAFLDADDLWHPDKLTRQYQCFVDDPELQYCVTHAQMFWSADLDDERDRLADHPRSHAVPGYATTTLLARRCVFDRIGLFDERLRFGDAVEWFIRASEANLKMMVLDEVLTYHRMHDSNLTRRQSDESRKEFLAIVRGMLLRKSGREAKSR
ncbi:MAG: glycosyltransferase [Deltaproteobacteria bacterium]|nr:glycosyltransferase [Deltaproteobacteria bacterium]